MRMEMVRKRKEKRKWPLTRQIIGLECVVDGLLGEWTSEHVSNLHLDRETCVQVTRLIRFNCSNGRGKQVASRQLSQLHSRVNTYSLPMNKLG